MQTSPLVSLFLAGILGACPVFAAEAHTHGVAQLEATASGDTLSLDLEIPLDSLLGFERVPKDAKDLAMVRQVAARLRQGETWFAPTPAAGCKLVGVRLASALIAPALLGEAGGDKAAGGENEHADLDAQYRFKCAKPAELKELEVKLFDAFKRIRTIDARLVTDKRQRAARLSATARTLDW